MKIINSIFNFVYLPSNFNFFYKEKILLSSPTQKSHSIAMDLLPQESNIISSYSFSSPTKKRRQEEESLSQEDDLLNQTSKKIKESIAHKEEEENECLPLTQEAHAIDSVSLCGSVEWYPLVRNAKGRIQVCLPRMYRHQGSHQKTLNSLDKRKLIYIFRNKKENRCLIGKTGTGLNSRMSKYMTLFNQEESELKAKKEVGKAFLSDVKKQPECFEVGVLHYLQSDENLEALEEQYIKQYKDKGIKLYNENAGRGGGSPHADEKPKEYAIPKSEIAPFTPDKYYPFRKEDNGRIAPQVTPGFNEKIQSLQHEQGARELPYVIKKMDTNERYIGVSINPARRSKEHGYSAEYFDPDNEKYDPKRKTGDLHPAMAQSPDKFAIGLLPITTLNHIEANDQENYVVLKGIAQVEQYIIKMKNAQLQGFNCNAGGGGPIATEFLETRPLSMKLLDHL